MEILNHGVIWKLLENQENSYKLSKRKELLIIRNRVLLKQYPSLMAIHSSKRENVLPEGPETLGKAIKPSSFKNIKLQNVDRKTFTSKKINQIISSLKRKSIEEEKKKKLKALHPHQDFNYSMKMKEKKIIYILKTQSQSIPLRMNSFDNKIILRTQKLRLFPYRFNQTKTDFESQSKSSIAQEEFLQSVILAD